MLFARTTHKYRQGVFDYPAGARLLVLDDFQKVENGKLTGDEGVDRRAALAKTEIARAPGV